MDGIGARLREARMHAKIDINEVELRTKIRAKYLRAIENEEWDLLPGEVYAKSFLRTYGEFLGLDTHQLTDDFRRRHENPSDHEVRPIAPRGLERERRPRGPLLPPQLIIGLVLIVVVVALYLVGKSGNSTPPPATHPAVTTPPKHPRARRRRAHHRAVASAVRLQLVPTGQVYVCLVDGTGKALIPGLIYATGQSVPVKTASKLLLTLGNSSVQMKVNGKTVPVTATPGGGAIGFELTPTATKPLAAAQQPRCS